MRKVRHHLIYSMTDQDVRDCFPDKMYERGLNYKIRGTVGYLTLSETEPILTGVVKGSNPNPYVVMVALERVGKKVSVDRTRCTCPIEFFCKHAAALLLEAISQCSEKKSESGLPLNLEHWLTGFDDLTQKRLPLSKERVLYILNAANFGDKSLPQLVPQARVARILQKGGYGTDSRRTDFGLLANGAAPYLLPEDEAIGRLAVAALLSRGNHFADPTFADSDLTRQVIQRMVETQRCFWRDKENPPLTAGELRKGELVWTMDEQGNFKLQIGLEGYKGPLVFAAGVWYVDMENWQIGPVEVDVPFDVLDHLLEAPPFQPGHASLVGKKMERFSRKFSIPLPEANLDEVVYQLPPVPILNLMARLRTNLDRHWVARGPAEDALVTYGSVSFDYGGVVVDLETSSPQVKGIVDRRLVTVIRDLDRERFCIDSLEKEGLKRKAEWFSNRKGNVFTMTPDTVPQWLRFTQQTIPLLRELGWIVNLDSTFPYVVVEAEQSEWDIIVDEELSRSYWFSLELGIEFEGSRLSLLPILMAALHKMHPGVRVEDLDSLNMGGFFYAPLPDGRMLALPFNRIRGVLELLIQLFDREQMPKKVRLNLLEALGLMSLEELSRFNWLGGARAQRIARKLAELESVMMIPTPEGFTSELRGYQKRGVAWLQFLREFELGGILADDMGLGKTVQTLAHLLIEKQNGRLDRPALVICPTSVVPNWISEAERLAPQLRVVSLHGGDRQQRFPQIEDADLVISTYALLVRDVKKLHSIEWSTVILDEAQAIKNDQTQAAVAACALPSAYRICLTGTPIENHLGELWSQFTFLMPGVLGTKSDFKREIRTPIEKGGDAERLAYLIGRIRPFVLRRTKSEVAKELPEKTIMIRHVEIEGDQRDLYETVRLAMHKRVIKEIASKGFERSQIVILEALLRLRQVCCDPRLVNLESARQVKESAKLNELIGMLTELVEEGRRVLLFSQFTSMLDLIEPELDRLGIPFVCLRGDTKDRASPVKRFQRGDVPLFLISLKAGGKGLNLTAADTVIHYDPWWNPAVEDQATDRAHRIGQDKPVFVYKLIVTDTVEEKMVQLQDKKRRIAEAVLDAGMSETMSFNETDIDSLFAPLPSRENAGLPAIADTEADT